MPGISFVEQMKGELAPLGEFEFRLNVRVADVDAFLAPNGPSATVDGWIECDALGGRRDVTRGTFTGPPGAQRFLFDFVDSRGRTLRFDGLKSFEGGFDLSVFSQLFDGEEAIAKGNLSQPLHWLLQASTSMTSDAENIFEGIAAKQRYSEAFLSTTAGQFLPKSSTLFSPKKIERKIALFSHEGVRGCSPQTYYFSTPDKIGLSMLRFTKAESDDVVVLLHGLTSSSDMYIMPEHKNLVTYLHENGYPDVFSVDWRGSMRHTYNLFPGRYTLDDIASNDMPAAFHEIRRIVGPGKRIHVICHCVGSIVFMMSLAAGLVQDIASVVSNSVSLTPLVPGLSKIKLAAAPALVAALNYAYISPRWGYAKGEGAWTGRLLATIASLFHPECDNPACHMVSFMWGSGRPACYVHANLDPVTHDRIGDLFGAVNTNYYIHVRKMAAAKRAIKMYPKDPAYRHLPDDYLAAGAKMKTPVMFVTGDLNRVFPRSNILTYESLRQLNPSARHELMVVPGYGHQDIFQGKKSAEDTFPQMLAFMRKYSAVTSTAATSGN